MRFWKDWIWEVFALLVALCVLFASHVPAQANGAAQRKPSAHCQQCGYAP